MLRRVKVYIQAHMSLCPTAFTECVTNGSLPVVLKNDCHCVYIEYGRNDYTCRRQFIYKPSVVPSCAGCAYTPYVTRSKRPVVRIFRILKRHAV